jgi:hypothetical protein
LAGLGTLGISETLARFAGAAALSPGVVGGLGAAGACSAGASGAGAGAGVPVVAAFFTGALAGAFFAELFLAGALLAAFFAGAGTRAMSFDGVSLTGGAVD